MGLLEGKPSSHADPPPPKGLHLWAVLRVPGFLNSEARCFSRGEVITTKGEWMSVDKEASTVPTLQQSWGGGGCRLTPISQTHKPLL